MVYQDPYEEIYSTCRRTLGVAVWGRVRAVLDSTPAPHELPDRLERLKVALALPDFIPELARIEWLRHHAHQNAVPVQTGGESLSLNPTLGIHPVSWRHLVDLIETGPGGHCPRPVPASAHVLLWRHPTTGRVHLREAGDVDLLALKLVVEGIDPRQAAAMGQVAVGAIQAALDRAIAQGLLLSPGSAIRREGLFPMLAEEDSVPFIAADTFTLQWHITQACDLHCKHCYDRSPRPPMPLDFALAVLEDLYDFCRSKYVKGHVTFTGGNPLLYPHFLEIYQAAFDYGFGLAILGNPASREQLAPVCRIAPPAYYQISLEGMAAHNDDIRGQGHFQRSMHFLDLLEELDIYRMVMLTLTRDNVDQVLPLAEALRNRAETFNFNRLSAVGEGARLAMPSKATFEAFLRSYVAAAETNPMLGLKDNLINIVRAEKQMPPFGGCTGFGCGAAFNFIAVLSDGEVHACRKFPSPIGHLGRSRLAAIYDSALARKYRSGGTECAGCRLSLVCRGCLAVTYSLGLDPFTAKDPFCFASPAYPIEQGRERAPGEII